MFNRRDALLSGLATGLVGSAARAAVPVSWPAFPAEEIALWPGPPPGAPARLPVEDVIETGNAERHGRMVKGLARPRMKVFRPAKPNGAALLVTPGGGYSVIVIDVEGYQIAPWLAERGWTVFVLYYRLPGEGWANRADVPLADAQRAMRLIRSRAATYGFDPSKVGALGFSAGGHVCGDLATRFDAKVYTPVDAADRLSARPAVAAPIYAVQSMSDPLAHGGSRDMLLGPNSSSAMQMAHSVARNVTSATPPTFLAHAEDDTVVSVENSVEMRAALKAAGVKVETHLFTVGGHGLGTPGPAGEPARHWKELFATWARAQGLG
ncbi:prolyl oligopeptidase family serine peptidase [Sphingomonas piscis]|uniref:Prolyl oligopeptidase family serine peptidase n=1 Tax=Sphingomonas piscis TaxID=2714943 RepID=A0A6G7YMS5_9SPHN|nr:prolyl oligopeptidase family serine peptidase [Sphingomonas piscis]QIK78044.1 prolyl oligopeptidase family serine peptidase [Sphingomonas piscis]